MTTVVLLLFSNIFMTYAWYYHLKHEGWPLWQAIVLSWLIAFFEYCLMVPANRIGYGTFTAYQLKIMQEAITLCVFLVFAYFVMNESPRWNTIASFVLIFAAVYLAFLPTGSGAAAISLLDKAK